MFRNAVALGESSCYNLGIAHSHLAFVDWIHLVELTELVNAIHVVELSAKTRLTAIRAMARAAHWDDEGIELDSVLEAIEDREAAAQTIVAGDFALPHAVIDWKGDFRMVFGRSRPGVEYGIPGSERVHLIVLFVVGRDCGDLHLELLAALAELLKEDEFRKAIIEAADTRSIEHLLREKVGLEVEDRPRRSPSVPRQNTVLVRQAIELMDSLTAQAMLLAVDKCESVPWKLLLPWEGRLLIIASQTGDELPVERDDTHVFAVPHTSLSRMDRTALGLLMAASSGLLNEESSVVCITGQQGPQLDSVTIAKPEAQLHTMFTGKTSRRAAFVRPDVIMRVLSLAIELAAEGREGQPVGAMFVLGDYRQVMRHAQQLVLNPFHGFSRSLRNVLDPSLAETVKEFALLDGAFVIQGDGTVLTAGTYLAPKVTTTHLPSGLGARHKTAAGITAHTQAMAITVSQSTGTVTVFRKGKIVLKLERANQTRW